jgi:hypothetical protein
MGEASPPGMLLALVSDGLRPSLNVAGESLRQDQ